MCFQLFDRETVQCFVRSGTQLPRGHQVQLRRRRRTFSPPRFGSLLALGVDGRGGCVAFALLEARESGIGGVAGRARGWIQVHGWEDELLLLGGWEDLV